MNDTLSSKDEEIAKLKEDLAKEIAQRELIERNYKSLELIVDDYKFHLDVASRAQSNADKARRSCENEIEDLRDAIEDLTEQVHNLQTELEDAKRNK